MTTNTNPTTTHEHMLAGARTLAQTLGLDFPALGPEQRKALVSAYALQSESGWDADALRACWTLRIPFTSTTDREFAEHLANLGLLNTCDMVRAARFYAYYVSQATKH